MLLNGNTFRGTGAPKMGCVSDTNNLYWIFVMGRTGNKFTEGLQPTAALKKADMSRQSE